MTEKTKENSKKIKKWLVPTLGTLALCAVLATGFALSKEHLTARTENQNATMIEIRRLENKISQLENVIKGIQNSPARVEAKDFAALNEKIDQVSRLNTDVLDSKAGISSVMGLIEKVDLLELEMKKLSKVSSSSALILTAAGLVEDAAKKRQPFIYEASVLEELSRNTPMEKSAHIISQIAAKGLMSREDLIDKFIKLYEIQFLTPQKNPESLVVQSTEQSSKDWKQSLKEKMSTLLVIEKIDQAGELDTPAVQEETLDDVYRLVRNGDFETAILKMNTNQKYQTEQFAIWVEDVRMEKVFDAEMLKIKAMTLGTMKTEEIKKGSK